MSTYGSREDRVTGGLIVEVDTASPAERGGLEPGMTLIAADGQPLADVLDWQWASDGETVEVEAVCPDGAVRRVILERDADEPWGAHFADVLFDGIRRCSNACAFCFMTQLPKGMRPSLYVRDDDFRLSFLDGNFITLTNLTDADIERIERQHLSPLYVSLHAVDPEVRANLVCAKEDRALERFDQLVEAGIDLHVQVVLVPGVNDGDELDRTLTWLAERDGVVSVGIVPVGFTRHQERITTSYTDQIAAATVIQQVQRWQFASKERDGVAWVQLADEFYLNARAPIPTAEWYDGFPQYENGIGMVRTFVDEATALKTELDAAVALLPEDSEAITFVTGVMAATTIAGALNACDAAGRARLLVVPNRFFGGNVSVTGLLVGEDLANAIAADQTRHGRPTAYVVPDVVLNSDGLTLDDWEFARIVAESGADVRLVSSDAAGLLEALTNVATDLPSHGKE